jgi:hypothetical protein
MHSSMIKFCEAIRALAAIEHPALVRAGTEAHTKFFKEWFWQGRHSRYWCLECIYIDKTIPSFA